MINEDGEETATPQHTLDKIIRVFDAITTGQLMPAPITVRRTRGDPALPPGRFLPPPPAGGFIVEGEESAEAEAMEGCATHLPLSMIPSALQMLDLPPADADVLDVFRNAAGGWDGSRDGQQGVSRKDWISVCSILLSQQDQLASSSQDETMRDKSPSLEESSAGSSDDEEYREPKKVSQEDEEELSEEDEDEYRAPKRATNRKGKGRTQPPTRPPKRKKKRGSSFEADEGLPKSMTKRQKAACREAFALFFPDVEDKDLDSQRITIKDIVRVSGLVKERLTAEDVSHTLTCRHLGRLAHIQPRL